MLSCSEMADRILVIVVVVVAIGQSQSIVASYGSPEINIVFLHTFDIGYRDGILKSIVIFLIFEIELNVSLKIK